MNNISKEFDANKFVAEVFKLDLIATEAPEVSTHLLELQKFEKTLLKQFGQDDYAILTAEDIYVFARSRLKFTKFVDGDLKEIFKDDQQKISINIILLYKIFLVMEANARLKPLAEDQQQLLQKLKAFHDWDDLSLKSLKDELGRNSSVILGAIVLSIIALFNFGRTVENTQTFNIIAIISLCMLGGVGFWQLNNYFENKNILQSDKYYDPKTLHDFFTRKKQQQDPHLKN